MTKRRSTLSRPDVPESNFRQVTSYYSVIKQQDRSGNDSAKLIERFDRELRTGAVAQLARAIALQAIGYGFDPRQLHQAERRLRVTSPVANALSARGNSVSVPDRD